MDRPEYTFDRKGDIVPKRRNGGLPRQCPKCGSGLEVFRARRPWAFRPLGVAVMAWPLLASLSAQLLAATREVPLDDGILIRLFGVWLVVPPIIGAFLMYRMPRLIPMECYTCGWRREIPLTPNREFDIDEDLD